MCRSFDMPRWNIDRLNTHIAAAALIVDDNEVDVNDLRDDLKIDNKEYVPFSDLGFPSANVRVESKHTSRSWVVG
jgi:hypothetical protein